MSANFNIYQYEDAYHPTKLKNWVVGPPPPCDKRPIWPGKYPRSQCCRPRACEFIAYDNGWLYPCAPRNCCKSPWGDYPTCSWERPSVRVRYLPRKPKQKPKENPCPNQDGPTTCQQDQGRAGQNSYIPSPENDYSRIYLNPQFDF